MEFLKSVLPWAQTILSILLVGLIMLQRSGAELGGAFGGGDGSQGTLYTRRGAERILFYLTIAFAIVFIVLNFLAFLLEK